MGEKHMKLCRRCVNPGHLEIGTHSDNLCDAFDRGRRGEQWRAVK